MPALKCLTGMFSIAKIATEEKYIQIYIYIKVKEKIRREMVWEEAGL